MQNVSVEVTSTLARHAVCFGVSKYCVGIQSNLVAVSPAPMARHRLGHSLASPPFTFVSSAVIERWLNFIGTLLSGIGFPCACCFFLKAKFFTKQPRHHLITRATCRNDLSHKSCVFACREMDMHSAFIINMEKKMTFITNVKVRDFLRAAAAQCGQSPPETKGYPAAWRTSVSGNCVNFTGCSCQTDSCSSSRNEFQKVAMTTLAPVVSS